MRDLGRRQRARRAWATHLIDEVAPSDRIVVPAQGQVLLAGSHDGLLAADRHDDHP